MPKNQQFPGATRTELSLPSPGSTRSTSWMPMSATTRGSQPDRFSSSRDAWQVKPRQHALRMELAPTAKVLGACIGRHNLWCRCRIHRQLNPPSSRSAPRGTEDFRL